MLYDIKVASLLSSVSPHPPFFSHCFAAYLEIVWVLPTLCIERKSCQDGLREGEQSILYE